MSYKPSRFNIIMDREEPYLIYNSLRCSLIEIDKDKIDNAKRLLESKNIEKSGDNGIFDLLASGGFIIPDEFDELAYLKLAYFRTKFSSDVLRLVIVVTKACNFKCSYCFENTESSEYLTEDRVENLVKFVAERIKKADTMFVDWFGGEPLLRFNVIEELSKRFIQLCDKYSCKYKAYITTNGYLLKPDVVKEFPALKIEGIQTTLDGPRDIHNKRRALKGGKETYDVILNNIMHILDNKLPITVNVRSNVDKENVASLKDWINSFSPNFKAKVRVQFAPMVPEGEKDCPAITQERMSMDPNQSGTLIPELMHFVSDDGYQLDFDMGRKNVYCNADRANNYVIGADLGLIACPVKMNKIGQITAGGKAEFDLTKRVNWLAKDPFNDEKCSECNLLPLCIGGCNLWRLSGEGKGCTILTYKLDEWVRLLYKISLRK